MRLVRIIRDLLLIMATISSLAFAAFVIVNQSSFLTVTTRSMEPKIKAGDMVVTKRVLSTDLKRGDVVVLPLPEEKTLLYTHRIFEVSKNSGEIIVKTKGDANPQPDSWSMRIISKKVPKEIAVLPTSKIFTGPLNRRWIARLLISLGLTLAFIGLFRSLKMVKK